LLNFLTGKDDGKRKRGFGAGVGSTHVDLQKNNSEIGLKYNKEE
jgi:hypothetical protein